MKSWSEVAGSKVGVRRGPSSRDIRNGSVEPLKTLQGDFDYGSASRSSGVGGEMKEIGGGNWRNGIKNEPDKSDGRAPGSGHEE